MKVINNSKHTLTGWYFGHGDVTVPCDGLPVDIPDAVATLIFNPTFTGGIEIVPYVESSEEVPEETVEAVPKRTSRRKKEVT